MGASVERMDKIKLSLFDVFAYMLPGIPLLMLIIEWHHRAPLAFDDVFNGVGSMSVIAMLALLCAAYVLGFSVSSVAFVCFRFGMEHWAKLTVDDDPINLSKRGFEAARMQHLRPSGFDSLHQFLALRAMAYGLSFVFALFAVGHFILCAWCCRLTTDELAVVLGSVTLAVLCFIRARQFLKMCNRVITDTIKEINNS